MLTAVILMKRLLIALFALSTFATLAFAQSTLPQNAMIVINSNGSAVGYGDIENGKLSLELTTTVAAGANLQIAITGPSGTQTLNATIDASGSVTVSTANGQSQDLASFAKANGLTGVEVSTNDGSSNDQASGSDQADQKDSATSQEDKSSGSAETSGSSSDQSGTETETETHSQTNVSTGDDSIDVGSSVDTSTSVSGGN